MGLHLRAACMVPRLVSISPTSGATNGGTAVTLYGYHLTGATSMDIDGLCTGFSVTSDAAVAGTTASAAAGQYWIDLYHPRGDRGTVGNTYQRSIDSEFTYTFVA